MRKRSCPAAERLNCDEKGGDLGPGFMRDGNEFALFLAKSGMRESQAGQVSGSRGERMTEKGGVSGDGCIERARPRLAQEWDGRMQMP